VAAGLKTVGVFIGMLSAYVLTYGFFYPRWEAALIVSFSLYFWLLPWPRFLCRILQKWQIYWKIDPIQHAQLIVGIILAIIMPAIELVDATWSDPRADLLTSIGWTVNQANEVHALGVLFLMVPVVLAGWQYGRLGMVLSLGMAGLIYILTPWWMPADSLLWHFYIIRGFVLLGVTLILAFTTTLLAEVQRHRERELKTVNQQLHQANRKLTEQTALVEEVAASRERTRLARELHDTLAHSLSGTAVQLQAVGTLLSVDPHAAGQELKSAQAQIKQGLVESRRAIGALRASPLTELGLAEALRVRVMDMGERLGLVTTTNINIHPAIDHARHSPLLTQTLYRIADEALLNIEKHAYAQHVHCTLCQSDEWVTLSVVDDGRGFDGIKEENDSESGHYGILGMKERATMVGGELQIEHDIDQGTQVCLQVPLKNNCNYSEIF